MIEIWIKIHEVAFPCSTMFEIKMHIDHLFVQLSSHVKYEIWYQKETYSYVTWKIEQSIDNIITWEVKYEKHFRVWHDPKRAVFNWEIGRFVLSCSEMEFGLGYLREIPYYRFFRGQSGWWSSIKRKFIFCWMMCSASNVAYCYRICLLAGHLHTTCNLLSILPLRNLLILSVLGYMNWSSGFNI